MAQETVICTCVPYEWNWSQDVEKCALDLVLSSFTHTNAVQAIALASKECPKFLRQNSDSFLTREAAGVKTRLFSRATASRERCTVVDAVSMRARTPPRSPIRARATKCLLGDDASREIACDACEPTATSKSYKRANTLIDLVSSSSIDDTVSVLTESVVLKSTKFPLDPLTRDTRVRL